MATPVHFLEVGELGHNFIGTLPFYDLHDMARGMMRWDGKEEMDMIGGYFACDNLPVVLSANLPDDIPDGRSDNACKNCFSIFRNPDEMDSDIVFRMRSTSIVTLCHTGTPYTSTTGATS